MRREGENIVKLKLTFLTLFLIMHGCCGAQIVRLESKDSMTVCAQEKFNGVSAWHRIFFGGNYRKEWAASVKLPVIHLSSIHGGLIPVKQGGGFQTRSLRLKDKHGIEWVLRSVEKYPDAVLPENLRGTFVSDVVADAMSAQHPYAALVVPPIAEAVGVPHAHPMIGVVAPDVILGKYAKTFEGTICLLEEREPTGPSVNFQEMLDALDSSNNNDFNSTIFLKAHILDVFIGDWDRHGDQWRFVPEKTERGFRYVPVPRDRDQVFYTNQGVFPYIESRPWVQPFFEGFKPHIRKVGTLLFTSTLMNARLINQFSYQEWMLITSGFVAAVTDSVLETALGQLPKSVYDLRHDELLSVLKARRADLTRAMSEYYYFLNKSVLIQTSNQNELLEIRDTLNNQMRVSIFKLSENHSPQQQLFSKTFDPSVTREIRFFTGKGEDSVLIDSKASAIKLRFSGTGGSKSFRIIESARPVSVFEREKGSCFYGDTVRFKKHLSNDSSNTAIAPGNLFNVMTPLINLGYNPDDGVLLGILLGYSRGLDYTRSAFSTKKFSSFQQVGFMHSFYTRAFEARYNGEWKQLIGSADLVVKANIYAPNYAQNYFGAGNETPIDKKGDYIEFYRTRFSLFKIATSLKWDRKGKNSFSVGPSLIYYHFDSTDNVGRYIGTKNAVLSYDSSTLSKDRIHGGLLVEYKRQSRNDQLLPTSGKFLNMRMQAYAGMNKYSRSFVQFFADLGFYRTLDAAGSLVIAERAGGGAGFGHTAFYQSMFIGGQGNLLGYRRDRFAGQYMAFNNLEARLRLASFRNYILPGQLGLIALYDIGRVWQKEVHSDQWHNGVGGGFYFAPAQMALFRFIMSYSGEGWYPVFSLGFRF